MDPVQLDALKAIGYLQCVESESHADEKPAPQNDEVQGAKSQVEETQNNEAHNKKDLENREKHQP